MSRKIIFVLSLFVLLFPLLYVRFNLVNLQAANSDKVHNLDTNLNYTTIQEAIDATETYDGHTILVEADIYYEHVVVNKSISLVGENKSTTIIDGSGNGTVVTITRDNVNVTGFTIQNSGGHPERGFYLDNVSHCNVTGNNIINNLSSGMRIWNSSNNNTISGNNITSNISGIYLSGSSNNITGNNMLNNNWGISLYSSSNNNTISGNNMTENNYAGISLYSSSNNTISRNNITSNYDGIYLNSASNNMFYHNNVVDNTKQVHVMDVFSENVWDNSVEGNYWSNYTGVDLLDGGDGIGDSPHDIDEYNTDRFPLMGPISFFDAGTWDETAFYVRTVSNSTISDFNFNLNSQVVSFNVSGPNETPGFCRVAIPRELLWCDDIFDWTIRVNGTSVPMRIQEYAEYTYLYFTYSHSVQNVEVYGTQVIPEFSSIVILLLFMITTATATLSYRRKRSLKA